MIPRPVGTTGESRIPVSTPRPSPSESRGGVVEEGSSLSQGASEIPARGKSNTLGETLPQPVAPIPPMDTPGRAGAVEGEATKASAPREAPPAVLPLPEKDAESKEGYQHVPPQELKNSKKKPQKVSAPKNPLEKEPGSVEISGQASSKAREKAPSSGTARSVQDAPAQPSAKEGTKGSGGWYIKK